MDAAIHSTSAEQRRIGSVDDSVHLHFCNVISDDLKRHIVTFLSSYKWKLSLRSHLINRYTVSGIYHTATASFHINITPPISPPSTRLSANTPTVPEMPNPIGIRVNILPIPNGTPQASHIRK